MSTTNGTNGHKSNGTYDTNGHKANESNGTNGKNGNAHTSALCTVDEFISQEYDYVVIGGGTAGLCVAARLTENPNVTVGVLEAGESRMDDPQVLTPSLFVTLPGHKEYDWMMETVPQVSGFLHPRTRKR
jgi:hypothetical protein